MVGHAEIRECHGDGRGVLQGHRNVVFFAGQGQAIEGSIGRAGEWNASHIEQHFGQEGYVVIEKQSGRVAVHGSQGFARSAIGQAGPAPHQPKHAIYSSPFLPGCRAWDGATRRTGTPTNVPGSSILESTTPPADRDVAGPADPVDDHGARRPGTHSFLNGFVPRHRRESRCDSRDLGFRGNSTCPLISHSRRSLVARRQPKKPLAIGITGYRAAISFENASGYSSSSPSSRGFTLMKS